MSDSVFSFENLQVYQKSLDFVDMVYLVSKQFPNSESYNLTSQFKRASVSISLNIAEGAGDTDAQFNRFLQVAMDSIRECVVCTTIAKRQNFVNEEQYVEIRNRLTELSKMTASLQRYIKQKRK